MNIIDIMDGLSGGIGLVAALAFLFISLPTEHIYVNMTAVVLAGSILGFLPYNLSRKRKLFMGDTGSLFIGYVLGALSLGTEYSTEHNAAILAPIVIGTLVGMALPLEQNFMAISIPAVIATIAVLFIDHRRAASVSHTDTGASPAEGLASMNSALSSK